MAINMIKREITTKKEISVLSEAGKNVLELKKVLFENQNNPLIFNGLLASVRVDDYESEVYQALINETVNEVDFERILIANEKYANMEVLKNLYIDLQKKLSKSLERKGQKYFTADFSPKDGGVVLIRKFGITKETVKREFRLTDSEVKKYYKNGFVEQYAQLKLQAVLKTMLVNVKKDIELDTPIHVEISDFYFNEEYEVYNIDFRIIIVLGESDLKPTLSDRNKMVSKLEEVLKYIQNDYYRLVKG